MFAVACNPSVKEASLSRSRKFTDPLPSRPMHRQSAKLDEGLRINDENDAVQSVKEEPDGSVVLRNPHASCTNHAPTRSLSRGEDPSITCVGQRDANNEVRGQAIEREINDPDIYQGLDQGRRPKSIFVCSSCSDSTVYQRLSGERCCSHQPNDTNEGKRQSVYASLSLERSSRDSVYAPLGTGVAVEVRTCVAYCFSPFHFRSQASSHTSHTSSESAHSVILTFNRFTQFPESNLWVIQCSSRFSQSNLSHKLCFYVFTLSIPDLNLRLLHIRMVLNCFLSMQLTRLWTRDHSLESKYQTVK